MPKLSKRMQAIGAAVDTTKNYVALEAFEVLKKQSSVKFVESIDVSIKLGIDPRKSDQVVRGAVVLPKGTGRVVRVAVFAEGDHAKAAVEAGADIVGFEDLSEEIKAGKIDFDVLIATPGSMRLVGQFGQILGPRGLMPNPKVGTVTNDIPTAVKNAKGGQVRYRADKAGLVHCRIGTVGFDAADLKENLETLLAALKKAKPVSSKGVYLKKITVSSTMGPGITIDMATLNVI
jgi:large subunit ribosomal protein L1